MAKRLTDTEKWNDDWYISLSNDYKIIWQWLLDNCNHAGICKRSMRLLNFSCSTNVSEDEMIKEMCERVLIVDNKWFIPKFIKFQYTSLRSNRPVIISVIKELEKHNLISLITESFGNDYSIIKDKDKDKDKDSLTENKKDAKSKNGYAQEFRSPSAQGQDVWNKRVGGRLSEDDDTNAPDR